LPDLFKTKPNLDRRGSDLAIRDLQTISGRKTDVPFENGSSSSRPSSRASFRWKRERKLETVPMKDRDWRGGNDEEMWWECEWEGMDGIGGTNQKGRRCFDRVRIWWKASV